MEPDKWTLHIFETFLNVLRRPKFGMEISEIKTTRHGKSVYVDVKGFGESVRVFAFWDDKAVRIKVTPADDLFGDSDAFKFKIDFQRSKPHKVRKSALIFVEKLRNKPVYDVMNS